VCNTLKIRNLICGQEYRQALDLLADEPPSPMIKRLTLHCNKHARNILDLRSIGCHIYHLGDIISEDKMNNILSKPLSRKRFRKAKVAL